MGLNSRPLSRSRMTQSGHWPRGGRTVSGYPQVEAYEVSAGTRRQSPLRGLRVAFLLTRWRGMFRGNAIRVCDMKKLRLLCAALAWPCTAAADAPFKESMDGGPEGVWISAGKAKRGNSIVTTRSPSFPPMNRQQTSSINIRNFIGTESRRTSRPLSVISM
jgi:hypothetical protein